MPDPTTKQAMNVPADCPLGRKEYETLVLLSRGLSFKQVAARRGVARTTIKKQAQRAREKCGLLGKGTGASLVLHAYLRGWLPGYTPPPEPPEVSEPAAPLEPAAPPPDDPDLPDFAYPYLRAFDRFIHRGHRRDWNLMAFALNGLSFETNVAIDRPPAMPDRIPERLMLGIVAAINRDAS